MSRLIVVSNRVADLAKAVQSGGLAVALAGRSQRAAGPMVWLGWQSRHRQCAAGLESNAARSRSPGDVTPDAAGL